MSDDHHIEVKRCHDRQKVEICTPNEVVNYSVEEVTDLVERLQKARDDVLTKKPPGPAPLDFSSEYTLNEKTHERAKEFATADSCEPGYKCHIDVGGWELSVDMAWRLHDWLKKALEYHEKCQKEKPA